MYNFILKGITPFDLGLTLDCGQAFRWRATEDGAFEGVARGKYLKVKQKDDEIIFYNTSKEEYENVWKGYFDIERDYGDILSRARLDDRFKEITKDCGGIRILNQDPWEALCSFIISQNNNIPRIKGIIQRLCEKFGENLSGNYTFPTYNALKGVTEEDLADLRSGFRAKYIVDAVEKCVLGEVDLNSLKTKSYTDAKTELMKIKGVGPKVADCTLLYGLGFYEAFPMDVWMKRAMEKLFADGLPENILKDAGIVQQYIFHFARTTNLQV